MFCNTFINNVTGVIESIDSNIQISSLSTSCSGTGTSSRGRSVHTQNVELDNILCVLSAEPVAESATKFLLSDFDDVDALFHSMY